MKPFEYITDKDILNDEKRREFNLHLNNHERSIKGIIKNGENYKVAVTVFDDYSIPVTPEKCREMAAKLSEISGEEISIVEVQLAPNKKIVYLVLENCFRIIEDGLKIYENEDGKINKMVIPIGPNIYKYRKKC